MFKINKDVVTSIFFILAFLLYVHYLKFSNPLSIYLYIIIPFVILIINNYKVNVNLIIYPFLILFIFISETSVFSHYFRIEDAFLLILISYSSFYYAYLMYCNRYNIIINRIFFYIVTAFIWYYIIGVFLGKFDVDIYNNIFPGYSRNVLSAIIIFLTFNLAMSYYQNNLIIPLYYVLASFFTCLLTFSRSALLVSSLFLLLVLFMYYGKRYLIISSFILFLGYSYFDIELLLIENSNFKNGVESERSDLIKEYMNGIFENNYSVFFGRAYNECCSLTVSLGGNIHNSFLSGHAKYGIIHTIFILLILLLVLMKKNIYLLCIAILIYIRYFFDQLGFFGVYDISIYYLVLLLLLKKKGI